MGTRKSKHNRGRKPLYKEHHADERLGAKYDWQNFLLDESPPSDGEVKKPKRVRTKKKEKIDWNGHDAAPDVVEKALEIDGCLDCGGVVLEKGRSYCRSCVKKNRALEKNVQQTYRDYFYRQGRVVADFSEELIGIIYSYEVMCGMPYYLCPVPVEYERRKLAHSGAWGNAVKMFDHIPPPQNIRQGGRKIRWESLNKVPSKNGKVCEVIYKRKRVIPECSVVRLARLLWEQEVAGSSPAAPTNTGETSGQLSACHAGGPEGVARPISERQ
jgi:hypothetical protein